MLENTHLTKLQLRIFDFMNFYVVKKFRTCVPGTKEHLESLKSLKRIIELELSIIGDAKDLDLTKITTYDQEITAFKLYKFFYPLRVLKTFGDFSELQK